MGVNRVKCRYHRPRIKLDKEGRRIEVRKRWPDGTEFRRFYPNETKAKNILTRIENAVLEGKWQEAKEELRRGPQPISDEGPVTVRKFSEAFIERSKVTAPKSWDRYKLSFESLNGHLGDIPMAEFKRRHLYEYVQKRIHEVKPGTVNRVIACLKTMFSYAVESA